MAIGNFPGGGGGPIQSSPNDDAITWLKAIATNLSTVAQQFKGLAGRAGTVGTFAMPAAASSVIANTAVKTTPASTILLTPANAAAATLAGSAKNLYAAPADFVAGVSFTVRTANATAAAGTEIFHYQVLNVA